MKAEVARAVDTAQGQMRVVLLDPQHDLAKISDEWMELARMSDDMNWAKHPDVFRAWHDAFCIPGQVRIAAVYDMEDALCGVMPIMRELVWRGPSCLPRFDYAAADRAMVAGRRPRPIPLRQITTPSSIPATIRWVGPLCRPGDTGDVFDAIAGRLAGESGWDVIVLPAFEDTEENLWLRSFERAGLRPWTQRLDRIVQNLARVRPFDEIVAEQSKKFRQNMRRARAAAEKAGLKVDVRVGTAGIDETLDTVAQVADASWKREGRLDQQVSLPYRGQQKRFFARLLSSADLRATPVITVASCSEGPIAALVNLMTFETVTALLIFMDARYAAINPGYHVMAATIDWAARNGIRRFDFNATHNWVRHFSDERRVVCNVAVFAPTMRGRLSDWIARTATRLR